jgi:hypothetical protein
VPVANAAALAGAIPGARLRVLDHAGHLVFIERFADVNREVVTFLKPRGDGGRGAQGRQSGSPTRSRSLISGLRRSLGRGVRKVWDGIF